MRRSAPLVRSWLAASALAVAVIAATACDSDGGVASGGQCFVVTDCAAGLACVPKGSERVCSSNLTAVETMIDSGMDAVVADAGALPSFDSGAVDSATPVDSGAASHPDTGTSTPDAATSHADTGTSHADTGTSQDAGHPVDSGTTG